MAVLQTEVIKTILKDPAVATVGGYIGAGGATSTENQGRRVHRLSRRGSVRQSTR